MSIIKPEESKVRDPLINGFSYDEIEVGDVAYFAKTISEHDVYSFAGITGDFNPAHVNHQDSEKKRFHQRISMACCPAVLFLQPWAPVFPVKAASMSVSLPSLCVPLSSATP